MREVSGKMVPVCSYSLESHDWYRFKRSHVASVRGESVKFKSIMRLGTYTLWSEAIDACEQGLPWFNRREHQDEVLVDGYIMSWIHAHDEE